MRHFLKYCVSHNNHNIFKELSISIDYIVYTLYFIFIIMYKTDSL